jgi:hypothetical protein
MLGAGPRPDAPGMINAGLEYWDFERASFDDELDAWRERTAEPAVDAVPGLSRPRRQLRWSGTLSTMLVAHPRRSGADPEARRPAARAPRQRSGLRRQPRRVPTRS